MNYKILEVTEDSIYQEAAKLSNFGFYHTQEWHKFLEKTFGWKVKLLLRYDKNTLVTFLPFVSKRRLSLSKTNISLPFSHEIKLASSKEQEDLEALPLDNLEVHAGIDSKEFTKQAKFYTTHLDLSKFKSLDDIYSKLDYKSIKYQINRAKKNNLEVDKNLSKENFKAFYELELETRKRQGSPMYPPKFFNNLYESFKQTDYLRIYIARYEGKPISASIFFHYGNCAIYGYSASLTDKEYRKLGGGEIVMWEAIQQAYVEDLQLLDFGTTPIHHTGLRKYKEKWLGESYEIPYSYFPKRENSVGIDRDSLKVKIITNILKASPKFVTKYLSPYLLKAAI